HRGTKRASFMWGLSTRSTRIERLWVEVGTQFARRWRDFQANWNLNPLGGTRNKGQSPADIRFISQTQHGVDEDQPGVHPTILEKYYGVEPEEDLDDEWQDIDDMISADQTSDVRHDAVDVPADDSPFNPELGAIFFEALEAVKTENII
ncbi:hypothetical protein B0H19DRAFT_883509, partial [Mycena capillaripes]